MHHYYAIAGIDHAKMRDEAYKRLGDIRHPEESTVHYHRATEHCDERCESYTFDMLEKEKTDEQ